MRYSSRQNGPLCRRGKSGRLFFNGAPVQAKLENTRAEDMYEQEADAMAGKVVNSSASPAFFKASRLNSETFGHGYNLNVPTATDGQKLDPSTRNFMEPKFGYDFSNVKIHNDSAAHQSASNINARAYTQGNNIVFGAGQYQPHTQVGKKLLAHELTHVVQQQSGALAFQRKPLIDDVTPADKFDDDIDEFRKNYEFKVVFDGFAESQKEAIIAVKDGAVIKVKIGPRYVKEDNEQVRKAWIKAEIIGKFVKNDRFEDLAYDPTHDALNKLNPPYAAAKYCRLNCPATAASLAEYLSTGTINKAYCNPVLEDNGKGYGFDVSMNTFSKDMSWKQAESAIRKQLGKHGDFVVVEARRSAEQMKKTHMTELHYFTIVNVKNTLFAIDASIGGIVSSDLQNFIDQNIVATTYRLAKGEFKVKLVIL